LTYRISFAVGGRARFLAHLETVDALLSALRRAGYQIALSEGMKPKPVVALALPRAVGVEGTAELADVELVGDHEPGVVEARLRAQLPAGFEVLAVERRRGKRAASLARGARYTVFVADDLDWPRAVEAFYAAPDAVVTRRSPKGERAVDVRRFCRDVRYEPGRLVCELTLTDEGSARPEELTQAIAARVGATATIERLVRTSIVLADEPVGATA
jgi:radical SAM-linked protein